MDVKLSGCHLKSKGVCDSFLMLADGLGVVDDGPVGRQEDGSREKGHFTII